MKKGKIFIACGLAIALIGLSGCERNMELQTEKNQKTGEAVTEEAEENPSSWTLPKGAKRDRHGNIVDKDGAVIGGKEEIPHKAEPGSLG